MQKWAILLYGLGISGGANVVFEHAIFATQQGVEVTFVTKERKTADDSSWHCGTEVFLYKTFEDITDEVYDVVIATEWRSAFDCYRINAKKYVYFVQSIESRFIKNEKSVLRYLANQTYEIPFYYITEATWIKNYLFDYYGKNAMLVLNGINKNLFNENGTFVAERSTKNVRFLVEGSVKNWLKNVSKTVELCKKAGAKEIWLVTPDENVNNIEVDRVFKKIPLEKMPEIYRSCDVLVKLSVVEGMFGPPLEMFHCGGTAITYDIDGAEEYLINGVNSIVVSKSDESKVVEAIQNLINNPTLLCELKKNALFTAKKWIDCETSNALFLEKINSFKEMSSNEKKVIMLKAENGANAYKRIEEILGAENDDRRLKILCEKKITQKKVYIYGAGYCCRSTIVMMSKFDIEISGIVVSQKENNPNTVFGHRVYEISELDNLLGSIFYISSDKYYFEIAQKLEKLGVEYV